MTQNNIHFELIDIIDNPPCEESLVAASNYLGDRKYLFNTSGLSYRKIGANAIKAMTDIEAIDALLQDPKLIKRPFLSIKDNVFLIGFNEEKWSELLLDE